MHKSMQDNAQLFSQGHSNGHGSAKMIMLCSRSPNNSTVSQSLLAQVYASHLSQLTPVAFVAGKQHCAQTVLNLENTHAAVTASASVRQLVDHTGHGKPNTHLSTV